MRDMAALNQASREVAAKRAAWKRRLHDDPSAIGVVLATKPDELRALLLIEILQWLPGFGHAKLARLGKSALGHTKRVNLLVELGAASSLTRHWVASELHRLESFYVPLTLEVAA